MRLRGFVPVEELAMEQRPPDRPKAPAPGPDTRAKRRSPLRPLLPDSIDDWEKRVSLFGEAEG
jgi:hypothetical protein